METARGVDTGAAVVAGILVQALVHIYGAQLADIAATLADRSG